MVFSLSKTIFYKTSASYLCRAAIPLLNTCGSGFAALSAGHTYLYSILSFVKSVKNFITGMKLSPCCSLIGTPGTKRAVKQRGGNGNLPD